MHVLENLWLVILKEFIVKQKPNDDISTSQNDDSSKIIGSDKEENEHHDYDNHVDNGIENFNEQEILAEPEADQEDNESFDIEDHQNIDIKLQNFQDKISSIITPILTSSSTSSSSSSILQSGIESLLRSCWVNGVFDSKQHGKPLYKDNHGYF